MRTSSSGPILFSVLHVYVRACVRVCVCVLFFFHTIDCRLRTAVLLLTCLCGAKSLQQGSPPFDGVLRVTADGRAEAYLKPPFTSNHASNLELLPNHDVLLAWHSGPRVPFVCCSSGSYIVTVGFVAAGSGSYRRFWGWSQWFIILLILLLVWFMVIAGCVAGLVHSYQ